MDLSGELTCLSHRIMRSVQFSAGQRPNKSICTRLSALYGIKHFFQTNNAFAYDLYVFSVGYTI